MMERFFYFSRDCAPSPFVSEWLVSGVIVASDLDATKSQLNAALAKISDQSSAFNWVDLQSVKLAPNGIAAITMGES